MAKGFNSRRMGNFGGGMNMNIVRQVQKMQRGIVKMQQGLETKTYTVAADGDVVSATVTGKRELKGVVITSEAVDPKGVKMLQDMIVTMVNEALRAAKNDFASTMQQLTGGFGLPFWVGHRGTSQRPTPKTADRPSYRRIWGGKTM